jgi:hypothetical protein
MMPDSEGSIAIEVQTAESTEKPGLPIFFHRYSDGE